MKRVHRNDIKYYSVTDMSEIGYKKHIDSIFDYVEHLEQQLQHYKELVGECNWEDDEDGTYWSDCRRGFTFIDLDSPLEHGFKHCPYCGKVLVIKQEDK